MTMNDTPINSDALSARLREYGQANPCNIGFALVCDMLADMPKEIACAYAERVRELPDARACEVADMLAAYAVAWNAEPPVAETYAAPIGPRADRCHADCGCDELATMVDLTTGLYYDPIYCAEHATPASVPLHITPAA